MKRTFLTFLILIISSVSFAGGRPVLENGVKLIDIKRPYTNTMSIVFFVKGGTTRETAADNGIGSLFSDAWIKSSELLKQVEFYGGSINASVSSDFMEVNFSVPTEQFSRLFGYYGQLILNPKVDKDVFDREKALLKEDIISIDDSPSSKAFRNFMSATYGDHHYALPSEGTVASVDRIQLKDMDAYAKKMLMGRNVTVAVAGNYTDDQLKKIKSLFAALPVGKKYVPDCTGSAIVKDATISEKDKNSEQAKLYIGYNAPYAGAKEYAAVKVMTDVLGGGMSSRYFDVLRKQKGYAYSVGAMFPSKLCTSRFVSYIGLDAQNVDDSVKTIDEINKGFVKDLSDDELDAVKNYMLGKILTDSQSNVKQAWYACFFENVGLGSTYFSNYIDMLRGITKEDVIKAAKIFDGPKTVYVLK